MGEQYYDSVYWVEVDRIKPNPFQPRRDFDEFKLQELAESIRQYGVLQPLVVTRKEIERPDGSLQVEYELIAGERRLRASKLARLSQVPVVIRTREDSDQMKLELAIIENLQRDDLNAIDRARAFSRLVNEFKLKHTDIGKKIGRSREYVSNTLRILSLPEPIQQLVAEGKLSEGHTRPVLRLNDRPEEQNVLVQEIVLKKLSVREAESIAQRASLEKMRKQTLINAEIIEIERELTQSLGTRVTIEPRDIGGKVVISYFSADDLRGLLALMQVSRDVPAVLKDAEQNSQMIRMEENENDTQSLPPSEQARDESEILMNDVPPAVTRALADRETEEQELYAIRNFTI